MKKKILLTLGVLMVLLVAAVVIVFVAVDADSFRGFIEDRAEAVLDRDVELGALRLSFLPVFGLEVDDVSVGAGPDETGDKILSIRNVVIGARLMPLLAKRLEVTSLELVEPSLRLERDTEGRWNVDLTGETEQGGSANEEAEQPNSAAGLSIDTLRVTGGRLSIQDASRSEERPLEIDLTDLDVVLSGFGSSSQHAVVEEGRLRVVAEELGGKPLELVLDDADLVLSPGSGGRPTELVLDMGLGGDADGTRFAVRGQLAGTNGEPTTIHLEIEGLPLTALGPALPAVVAENIRAGRSGLAMDLTGRLPENFTANGELRVAGLETELTGGREIDARLDFDLAVNGGGELVDLRTCDVVMDGRTIGITGTIEGAPDGRRVDLALRPTSVTAEDLTVLAALGAADLGLAVSGESPIEIEGGIRGLLSETQAPEVRGRIRFSGLTVEMAALSRPVSDLVAEVSLLDSTLEVTGLRAQVGDNDVAGNIKFEATEVPFVVFDLEARHADLDELLALVAGDGDGEEAETGPPAADSFLIRGIAEGALRVGDGSWGNLQFRSLDARLRMADGVATLDPVSMEFYDGRFQGRLVSDLKTAPPEFEFSGDVEEMDLAPFLTDQIEGGDLLEGRLTGRVAGRGSGADPEAIIRNLQGEGTASIADGQVGKLDLLGSIGEVAGVFGQRTIANLATTMSTDATRFSQMEGNFRMDGGKFSFDELILQSAAFSLGGAGDVDLMSSVLDGDFQIRFSPEVSAWMKQEGSRAAELFWDSKSGRIVLPLGLSGPFDGARASIDWTSAAKDMVQRTVEKELAGLLGSALGGSRKDPDGGADDDRPEAPGEHDATSARVEEPATSLEVRRGASPSGSIVIEVTKTGWGGSFLAQDFKIEGRVSGSGVKRVWLAVVDASGGEIQEKDVTNFDKPVGSDVRMFKTRADGNGLVLAAFPLTVTLTAVDGEGESAVATLVVDR